MSVIADILDVFSALFVVALGLGAVAVAVMYVVDISQTTHAIRRNYPVVGRFRYAFEAMGEFFRQYFFAMDREELPFNRAERAWAYRAAKGVDSTVAFGSTRDLRPVGTAIFVNAPFPGLDEEHQPTTPLRIGEGCRQPYVTRHFFHISAMSFGAISKPAVLALSRGAAAAGCWLNTGEGGLAPYHLEGGADLVFQIGTAKYGVRDEGGELDEARLRQVAAHEQVRMFEIKLSQGAKPGKGGILPGGKVTPEIAAIRLIPQGKDSLSPNRHAEIRSVPELLDFVVRIREITGKPTGFKTVIGSVEWLDDLCAEIRRRGRASAPDFITIDSGDGGTGAAPMALIDNVGLPIRESLPMVTDTLTRHGLKDRIRLVASGKLITPAAVAHALCMGADLVQSARGFMFALGCIQALRCNQNTCPTGITTHDPRLQRGLVPEDKAGRVARYQQHMEKEVSVIAHSCGVAEARQLRREHCRIVQENGRSVPLAELHPAPLEAAPGPVQSSIRKLRS
jgi:glutamate synthase domain-containing protein 2